MTMSSRLFCASEKARSFLLRLSVVISGNTKVMNRIILKKNKVNQRRQCVNIVISLISVST